MAILTQNEIQAVIDYIQDTLPSVKDLSVQYRLEKVIAMLEGRS